MSDPMQTLIQAGVLSGPDQLESPVSERGDNPLLLAARTGNAERVQLLLAARANLEAKNNAGATALVLASQSNHPPVLQILLAAGAELDAVTVVCASPVFIATQKGHVDCLKLLLDAKASPNTPAQLGAVGSVSAGGSFSSSHGNFTRPASDQSSLSIGSTEGGMGADGRYVMPAKSGVTPTFIAAQQGQLAALKVLIAARANIDQGNNGGVTPVCIAAAEANDACLQALVDAGANVNTLTSGGITPVYIASHRGHADCLRVLVSANANCNTPTNEGATAVFAAAQGGHLECVRELLVGGAVLDSKVKGKTPKQIAKSHGHLAVAEMISDAIKARRR